MRRDRAGRLLVLLACGLRALASAVLLGSASGTTTETPSCAGTTWLPSLRTSTRVGLVAFLSGLLALSLVAQTGDVARAATAQGGVVWSDPAWTIPSVDCATVDCLSGRTITGRATTTVSPAPTNARWWHQIADPRTLGCWPLCTAAQLAANGTNVGTMALSAGVYSVTWNTVTWKAGERFFLVSSGTANASGQYTGLAIWDLGQPAPTTSAPPPATTSAPPPTETPPATTSAAPTETTSAPTSSPPPPGGTTTLTCEQATPCYVRVVDGVPIDVGSIEVSALTSDQWTVIEMTAGILVFFAAASFWTTLRRRGA
jgi:hypothetical protein